MFGLTSLSTVTRVPREMDAIAEECVRQAQRAGVDPSVSYRVQARRADKTFPFTSPEINRLAGEAVARATDGLIDLSKNADVTLGVEVREDGALIFGRIIPAPGGLPVGVEGRVVGPQLRRHRFARARLEDEEALQPCDCRALSPETTSRRARRWTTSHNGALPPPHVMRPGGTGHMPPSPPPSNACAPCERSADLRHLQGAPSS